jgi:hypothetical protein
MECNIGDWIVGDIGSAMAISQKVEYKIYSNKRARKKKFMYIYAYIDMLCVTSVQGYALYYRYVMEDL